MWVPDVGTEKVRKEEQRQALTVTARTVPAMTKISSNGSRRTGRSDRGHLGTVSGRKSAPREAAGQHFIIQDQPLHSLPVSSPYCPCFPAGRTPRCSSLTEWTGTA